MKLKDLLKKNQVLLFDGAMGTELLDHGMKAGEPAFLFHMKNPDVVGKIHREYLNSGARILTSNTFGISKRKLPQGLSVEEVVGKAISIARKEVAKFKEERGKLCYVALDIGPLGELVEPLGEVSFDEAYREFASQVEAGIKYGADLILIETMSDIYEAKAAILAAKEHSNLPVFLTMTFQEDGRTFLGTTPEIAVTALDGLGIDAIGINCSFGPKKILPLICQMKRYTDLPLMVQPNAGIPSEENGKEMYLITVEEFGEEMEKLLDSGVQIIGGCCGTTPEYICRLHELFEKRCIPHRKTVKKSCVCGRTSLVEFNGAARIAGERINPTGKEDIKKALRGINMSVIEKEALEQGLAGADILDVNAGMPDIDEPFVLKRMIQHIQKTIDIPIQVDSTLIEALEKAARYTLGKPILNSVNGTKESMEQVFPIVKKYGTAVIALTLDEDGIPDTAEKRVEIGKRILETASAYGIKKEDIFMDCLVMTASTNQRDGMEVLKTLSYMKRYLGVKTCLGISNISYGLPNREALNHTYLAMALYAGVDLPIIDPLSKGCMEVIRSFRVLNDQDWEAKDFIRVYGMKKNQGKIYPNIYDMVFYGNKNGIKEKIRSLLKIKSPMEIVEEDIIPTLNQVGKGYEEGSLFLPQLMASAEVVQAGLGVLQESMDRVSQNETMKNENKILLATVKGDIHDIGKNIVKMLLKSYGYTVVDLGMDVDCDTILETIEKEKISVVGLSALMTTTVRNMEEIIREIKKRRFSCKVIVGGAVLNEAYAEKIGADFYGKDAMRTVAYINEYLRK